MQKYLKFLPLVVLFSAGLIMVSLKDVATATPAAAPSLSAVFAPLGGTITVRAPYVDETPVTSAGATLASSNAIGLFLTATLDSQADETVSVLGTSVRVTEDSDTIAQAKVLTATFRCDALGSTFFMLSQDGIISPPSLALTCGGYSVYAPPYYGVYPPPPNAFYVIGQIDLTAPAALSCDASATVIATILDTTGRPAPDGTTVRFTATQGTITPLTTGTLNGKASASFTAPSTTSVATIGASSSTMSDYATLTVSCLPPSPPVVLPPPAVAPTEPAFVPPNTGDAGLLVPLAGIRSPATAS